MPSPATPAEFDPELFEDLRSRTAERRARERGYFYAESPGVVARLIAAGGSLRHLLVTDRRRDLVVALDGLPRDRVTVMSEPELFDLVGFEMHRGLIGLFDRPEPPAIGTLAGAAMLGVLEGVNDHDNLGAIIRSGTGLGVGGFLLDPTTADPFARRSVRVSMGTVLSVPIVRSGDLAGDLGSMAGRTVFALDPAGSRDIEDLQPTGPVAVMVGAEGPGLSGPARAAADFTIRIRMDHGLDSINVAHAAAIAFHRLRSGAGRATP